MSQRDPTRTAGLRAEYTKAIQGRIKKVRLAIWEGVGKNDALHLGGIAVQARVPTRYDFPSDPAGKAKAFLDWLNQMVQEDVLEISTGEARQMVSNQTWQNVYVRAAYGAGIARTDAIMRSAAVQEWARRNGVNLLVDPDIGDYALVAAFNRPIHADLLALLYTRNFNELKGITDAMSSAIAQALAEGMVRGFGAKEMARLLVQRVDKIAMRRAMLLARTEIIRAFAEATLNRFEELGVKEVVGEVELSTAGDHRVCDRCQALVGKRMTIKQARGLIPVHPQCRCTWLPVVK